MELDQALYYMIGNSIIRIIVLDQLGEKNVKGLFEMRPTPSFHAVFASTDEIIKMYRQVSTERMKKIYEKLTNSTSIFIFELLFH